MENRESIKNRMYRNAARLWDVKSVEDLDPLIKLLIEALSSEIHRLSSDIHNIEIRLLDRIAQLLTPDMLVVPQPSHMIMTAQPLEERGIVDKMDVFFFDDPFKNRTTGSLSFCPTGKFSLIKGDVKALICGGELHIVENNYKEILARSIDRSEVLNNTVWIGLDIDERIKNIQDLSIFIDFPNTPEHKYDYFPLLSFTQWLHEGNLKKTVTGVNIVDKDEKNDSSTFFTQYDILTLLDTKVLSTYDQNYITIKDSIPNIRSQYRKLPEKIESLFMEGVQDSIESPMLWLEVKFPPNFKNNLLSDILVSINSFPVSNKKLRPLFSKSKKMTNIIPLLTVEKEYFLSVHSVKDEYNNEYEYLPYKNDDRPNFGTYTIKRGGVERFDTRDAKEYISNLIDLLRDESVAFSMLGKDYLLQAVDDMKMKIAVMEQRLMEVSNNKEVSSYLVIDSDDTCESIFVDYWTTNCEFANNIKAGTLFKSEMDVSVDKTSTVTLTPSVGGRSISSSSRKLDMYKYVLTTRDRIFTAEDIVNFCYSEFGDYFSFVEVKNGVQISPRPKEGLIRTIDVYTTLKTEFDRFSESKQDIKARLFKLLTERSPNTFNYRIFI